MLSKLTLLLFVASAALTAGTVQPSGAANGEVITVLCSDAFKGVMEETFPVFEHESSRKLAVQYDSGVNLKRRVDAGEAFDVAILPRALLDDSVSRGAIAGPSRTAVARSAVALAARADHAAVDISSIEAFTRTLRGAKSIAYQPETTPGAIFGDTVDHLKLRDALQGKLKVTTRAGEAPGLVTSGGAEFAVLLVNEILQDAGLRVAGTFPAELAASVALVAGVSAGTNRGVAAGEFVNFLMGTTVTTVLKKHGMERVDDRR